MTEHTYSALEKLSEIEREIAMRRRVYPALIAKGTLTQRQASTRLDTLLQVASDYRQQVTQNAEKLTPQSDC